MRISLSALILVTLLAGCTQKTSDEPIPPAEGVGRSLDVGWRATDETVTTAPTAASAR